MTIIYILQIAWLLIFAFLIVTTLIFTIFWGLCSNPRVQSLDECINFTQFSRFFIHVNQSIDEVKLERPHVFLFSYLKTARLNWIALIQIYVSILDICYLTQN